MGKQDCLCYFEIIEKLLRCPILQTKTTTLRAWHHKDRPCIDSVFDDQHITESTTVPTVITSTSALRFIQRQQSRSKQGSLSLAICNNKDEAIGLVALIRQESGVYRIGYWLCPKGRGRGHAKEAVTLVTDWAAEIVIIEALVEKDNQASIAVLEKCGYQRTSETVIELANRTAQGFLFVKQK